MIRSSVLISLAALTLATGASAQSLTYTTKHWSEASGDVTVTLNGQTYINHGLVGAGHLSAATLDFAGDTLGSFSSMALRDWKKEADGSYSGDIYTLPDRGPNDVGSVKGTADYANRLHALHLTLTADGKVTMVPTGGVMLKDATGKTFTGKEPGANILTRDGVRYPSPASGDGAGRISLDSEGLALLPNGSFYVSDEYACGIYLFDKDGHQTGVIATVPALMPVTAGKIDFNSDKAPDTGRRNNQGLEAISVTPDGHYLVTIVQSAAMQDVTGKNAATRNNTRVLVYDISRTKTPAQPVGHYVLQLPTYRENGDGGPADATAAQSEMQALSDTRFLVLSRDGNGRGKGSANAPVYKSVLLIDTTGATNLAGTPYEQTAKPVARDGALVDGIVPVRQAELINILNPVQLARFGMNLDVQPSTPMTLPEKLEAMAIAPALDPKAPNDVFLLMGNDNDFETTKGRLNGQDFDAGLTNDHGSGAGDNDNLILVYRLTLPAARQTK